MSGDRSVAPTAARVRRAWKAGVRAPHRWLAVGGTVAAVTLVTNALGVDPGPEVTPLAEALADPGAPDPGVLWPVVWGGLRWALWLAGAAVSAWVLVAIATGTAGPVVRTAAPAVRPGTSRGVDLVWGPLAVVGGLAVAASLLGVLAGASRAPGATLSGLSGLWHAWGMRVGMATAAVAVSLGLVELGLERFRLRRRLHASRDELREERRAQGRAG